MAKAIIGNQSAVTVPLRERERVRQFYCEVLGGKLVKEPMYVMDVGRMLVLKKDYAAAIAEFRQAVEADPANGSNHDLLGQALENSGNRDAAIAEYREALSVGPKDVQARLDLASALEKKGDWVGTLENYHQAALDEPPIRPNIPPPFFDAQRKYANARRRFQQHLADLRSHRQVLGCRQTRRRSAFQSFDGRHRREAS